MSLIIPKCYIWLARCKCFYNTIYQICNISSECQLALKNIKFSCFPLWISDTFYNKFAFFFKNIFKKPLKICYLIFGKWLINVMTIILPRIYWFGLKNILKTSIIKKLLCHIKFIISMKNFQVLCPKEAMYVMKSLFFAMDWLG